MLKEIISYEDFDGVTQSDTLYFNISKSELADNLHLKDRFDSISKRLQGPQRELSTEEATEILDLVKTFMKLSYGERSADGKRFAKSEDIWNNFTYTAAYDAFLFSLFENPEKAVGFLLGVLPKDLREEAQKTVQAKAQVPETSDNTRPTLVEPTPAPVVEEDNRPAYQRENREPNKKELQEMTKDEIVEAMMWQQNQ